MGVFCFYHNKMILSALKEIFDINAFNVSLFLLVLFVLLMMNVT